MPAVKSGGNHTTDKIGRWNRKEYLLAFGVLGSLEGATIMSGM